MLFLGTMFAPTQDRHDPGQGFTHVVGDVVTVATAQLGQLVNRVNTCDQVAPWTYGISALLHDLARRNRASARIPLRAAGIIQGLLGLLRTSTVRQQLLLP